MSSMKTSSAFPARPRAGVPHVLTNATLLAILHLPGSNRRSLAHGGVGPLPAQPPHQAEYQTQGDTWKRDPQSQAPVVTDLRRCPCTEADLAESSELHDAQDVALGVPEPRGPNRP